jgi:hypothetical protein
MQKQKQQQQQAQQSRQQEEAVPNGLGEQTFRLVEDLQSLGINVVTSIIVV